MKLWFWLAILDTFLFALSCVIDLVLLKYRIYRNEYDALVIFGFIQLLSLVLIPLTGFSLPQNTTVVCAALLSGFLVFWSYLIYFKTVNLYGDIALIVILWNILLAFVPILALVFLAEELTTQKYFAIFLILAAVNIFAYVPNKKIKKNFKKIVSLIVPAVFILAVSMILLKFSFKESEENFWTIYYLASIGMGIAALISFLVFFDNYQKKVLARRVRKFFWFFLAIELVQASAEFFSNLATKLGNVSLVVAVESLQSAFIMLISLFAVIIIGAINSFRAKKVSYSLRKIFSEQLVVSDYKIFALILMAVGAYLASG